jgi:signal transduction histidine kinase
MNLFATKAPTPHHTVLHDLLVVRSLLGLTLAGLGVFAVAAGGHGAENAWGVAALGSIIALSGLPLALLARRGRLTTTARLMVAIDLPALLAFLFLGGGTSSAALLLLLWPPAAAALLLGPKEGLLMAALVALLLGGLHLLEQQWQYAPDFLVEADISLTSGWPRVAAAMLIVMLATVLFIMLSSAAVQARAAQAERLAAAEEGLRRTEARAARLTALEEMNRVIQRIQDLDLLLPRALARMASILEAEAAFIALQGDEGARSPAPDRQVVARLNLAEETARELLLEAENAHPDLPTTPALGELPREISSRNPFIRAGFSGYIVAPLRSGDEFLGLAVLAAGRRFDASDPLLLGGLSAQLAIAIKNVRFTEELRRANEELLHLDHMKSDFLATMSHELRTPLTSIIGYSDMLLSGMLGAPTEQQENLLRRILSNSETLLSLINDILDLTKIEAGKLELALEPVEFRHALDRALGLVETRAAERRIKLGTVLPPDLPLLLADPSKLEQILLNLLTNSIKFTEELGSVTVEARPAPAGMIEIRVTDTGVGISSEDFERIFERFTQLDNTSTRNEGGTGLGLSITKDLIELHGGAIAVHSQPGKGTTFTFTIPRAVEPAGRAGRGRDNTRSA